MTVATLSLLLVGLFIIVLLAGLPLAFATGAVAVVFAYLLFGEPGLTLIISRIFTLMGNYVLVSVPLFIFMACVLERAGVAEAIFHAVHVWAGRIRGGLAVAVIISCALMAAMVGVIGAEIVTMGVVALPAMLKRGYHKKLALGSICAGGGLATLIPPSVVFILYGLTAGVSVGQLYMAGVGPGLLLAGLYIAYIVARCYWQPEIAPLASKEELAMSIAEKLALLRELILPALIAFGVLGSLYLGIATPTEAAGVGVVGAMAAAAINRRLTWNALAVAVADTTRVTAMLYWLFFGSSAPDRGLHAGRRHQASAGCHGESSGGPDRRRHHHPDHLDHTRLLHRLDWHPAADGPDLRPGGLGAGLRPGLARRHVLPQHADLLYLSSVRPGGVLSQGRGAARRDAEPDLRFDMALYGAAGARAHPGPRLSADRALAAEHDAALTHRR